MIAAVTAIEENVRRLCIVAACLAITPPVGAARRPDPLQGTLLLDIADPVVELRLGDVPVRLRVSLDARDGIELDDAVLARLGLPISDGPIDKVGRVDVPSSVAPGILVANKRALPVTLSSHGHCCAVVDGIVGPAMLPYAVIRFVRTGGRGGTTRNFTMTRTADYGLEVVQPVGRRSVRVHFDLQAQRTVATAAAGAMIAAEHGGMFDGETAPVPVAFGVDRPARMIALRTAVELAGFRFDRLLTRTADFGGRHTLPQARAESDDLVVRHRVSPQRAWPAVMIGRDRLDRCSEAEFRPGTLTLGLTCDFAG